MPPLPRFDPTALLWGQQIPDAVFNTLQWLYAWGEPRVTIPGLLGGVLTWLKVVGLFCLLGWAGAWLITGLKDRQPQPGRPVRLRPLDVLLFIGLAAALMSALAWVLLSAHRLPERFGRLPSILGMVGGVLVLVWVEARLWAILRRRGTRGDRVLFVAMHLGLLLGFAVSFLTMYGGGGMRAVREQWFNGFIWGGRLGATYMGLVVLARVVGLLLPELAAVRWRRLYAIAWQCWTEAFRRMWAPWVVLVVFAVILAFTSWFLEPPRPAELGRLYAGTLMLFCSLLLTILVVILAPISLPNDVRQQTIFTVVSKPVRRLELIWGRMLGYMSLVTVLLLLFGAVSLFYYYRQVGAAIRQELALVRQAEQEDKKEFADQHREQANQLITRMRARVPIRGSLLFFDSRGQEKQKGIDVGLELPTRSFVEGATPSRAVWRYGRAVVNPRNRNELLDIPVPVDDLLQPGTIEYLENRLYTLQDEAAAARQAGAGSAKAAEVRTQAGLAAAAEAEAKRVEAQLANLRKRERELRAQGKAKEADELHSPRVKVEMTFNVYRTTKGEIGEPVLASLVVANPRRPGIPPYRTVIPIREYYTNRHTIPASILAGSGGELTIEVKCLTANQYLGMAENDLILLSREGRFGPNFFRGLVGIWLQAMVLTAIGVCMGTFLSWPVALLATVFFFLAGNIGFAALQQFALSAEMIGGGPFESLIRMLSHENLVSELTPTVAVVTAKTLDSIVMPVMSRLVYLVPNFTALDVSNTVAQGFAVTWSLLAGNLLLALGYTLPFSIAAYFILRHREVAA
jgi:Sec-independent protein translocase protein TatA